jgi:tetratricopeptide (TPR) repeat protein
MNDRWQTMSRERILERIEKCRKILKANPRSQIFAALAEAYRKLGDLKSALDACNDGLREHPEYGSAYLVLAKIARDQKRLDEAERAAQRAIELEGRTRSAEILLSDIYLQTGKFQRAEEILDRLAEADPSNETVQKLRALVRKASKAASVGGTESLLVPTRTPSAQASSSPPAAGAASSPGGETDVVDEPGSGKPNLDWEAVMSTLDRYPHLLGKVAVGYDGLLLETDLEVSSEAEAAAAMAAELFGAVRTEWPSDSYGALEQLLVETGEASWWIWPFPDFLLVLWCDPAIHMGPLRMRLHKYEQSDSALAHGGTA